MTGQCVVCHRGLKNPKYVALGMGPVCARRNGMRPVKTIQEERREVRGSFDSADTLYPEMKNRRMAEKLADGNARDLSGCERTAEGDYVVPWFDEEATLDYCDAKTEGWMWSVGKFPDGRYIASTSGKFYQNPECQCVWLR